MLSWAFYRKRHDCTSNGCTHFTETDSIFWLRDRSGTNGPIRLGNKKSAQPISSKKAEVISIMRQPASSSNSVLLMFSLSCGYLINNLTQGAGCFLSMSEMTKLIKVTIMNKQIALSLDRKKGWLWELEKKSEKWETERIAIGNVVLSVWACN